MKLSSICCTAILALSFVPMAAHRAQAQDAASPSAVQNGADRQNPPTPVDVASIPLEKLVTATCRQAWHMGGKTQDGFYDIVERLTALSAANRRVTLPDDQTAGAKAGEWIRTQALKDPDQLLYAVVDHAVLYSITKGRATSTKPSATTPASK